MITRCSVVVTTLLLFCWTGTVLCLDETAKKVILLDLSTGEEPSSGTIDAMNSHLSELDTTLEVRPVEKEDADLIGLADGASKEPGVAAVIWIDTSSKGKLYLYFAAGGEGRVLVRTLEESSSGGRSESLAIIVRSSVQALMNGMVIGIGINEVEPGSSIPYEPEPEPALKPEPQPRPESESFQFTQEPVVETANTQDEAQEPPEERLSIFAGYLLQTRSSDHPVQHGLLARLDVRTVAGLSFFAGFLFQQAVEGRGDLATVEVRRTPLEIGGALRVPFAAVILNATAAFVLDFVQVDLKELRSQMEPGWTGTDFIPGALVEIGVELPLNDRLFLGLSAGAEFPFKKRGYTASGSGGTEVLVDSWPVSPRFFAGMRGVAF